MYRNSIYIDQNMLYNGADSVFLRTFHLVSNPDLVLAVSMTKVKNEARGYPVIIQVRYAQANKKP
jgi:hypothetical protein